MVTTPLRGFNVTTTLDGGWISGWEVEVVELDVDEVVVSVVVVDETVVVDVWVGPEPEVDEEVDDVDEPESSSVVDEPGIVVLVVDVEVDEARPVFS